MGLRLVGSRGKRHRFGRSEGSKLSYLLYVSRDRTDRSRSPTFCLLRVMLAVMERRAWRVRGRVDRDFLLLVGDKGSCSALRFTPRSLPVPVAGRVEVWGDRGLKEGQGGDRVVEATS